MVAATGMILNPEKQPNHRATMIRWPVNLPLTMTMRMTSRLRASAGVVVRGNDPANGMTLIAVSQGIHERKAMNGRLDPAVLAEARIVVTIPPMTGLGGEPTCPLGWKRSNC